MKTTNNQFSNDTIALLKAQKGKILDSISHEPFIGTPKSYGMIYLSINKKKYVFKAYEEPMDYFGASEDISKARFEFHRGAQKSSLVGVKFVTDTINQKIMKITLVNTEETMKIKETCEEFAFLDTLGFILTLQNDCQLALFKDGIFETISIYQGCDPKNKIQKLADNYLGDFSLEAEGKSRIIYIDL